MESAGLRQSIPRHFGTIVKCLSASKIWSDAPLVMIFSDSSSLEFFSPSRLLDKPREPVADVVAIYFVSPTEENILRIAQVLMCSCFCFVCFL